MVSQCVAWGEFGYIFFTFSIQRSLIEQGMKRRSVLLCVIKFVHKGSFIHESPNAAVLKKVFPPIRLKNMHAEQSIPCIAHTAACSRPTQKSTRYIEKSICIATNQQLCKYLSYYCGE